MVETKNKQEKKIVDAKKADDKNQEKINGLKIEFLKQGSKKKDIKREIARLLTLQNKTIGENK